MQLFAPQGTAGQHFAQFGWVGEGASLPDRNTVWQSDGETLSAATPVTLTHDNGEGQQFRITLSIDENYMITAEQTVANTGSGPIVAIPFATITRTDTTASLDTWLAHSGPMGVFGDSADYGPDYGDLAEEGVVNPEGGTTRWLGFSDIYWLSALVPQNGSNPDGAFRSLGGNTFRADVIYQPATVGAGRQVTRTTQLFAGAKESAVLDALRRRRHPAIRPRHRLGLVPLVRKASAVAAAYPVRSGRQFRCRDHPADGDRARPDVPHCAEGLCQHGRDEGHPAQDEGAAGTLQGRQAEAAAGNEQAVQGRGRQSARRLPAHAAADPGLLRAVQGADPGDRDAPPAVLSCGSRICPRPTRQ